MLSDAVRKFVSENHLSTLSTFRRSGAVQISLVLAGPYHEGVAFSTPRDRAKCKNLLRDPRCSISISTPDWFSGYVEGKAQIMGATQTPILSSVPYEMSIESPPMLNILTGTNLTKPWWTSIEPS